MKVRKQVANFAEAMEVKLKQNDHKEHWSEESIDSLYDMLVEEKEELRKELAFAYRDPDDFDIEQAQEEAIDVANFAMMIWDNLSRVK